MGAGGYRVPHKAAFWPFRSVLGVFLGGILGQMAYTPPHSNSKYEALSKVICLAEDPFNKVWFIKCLKKHKLFYFIGIFITSKVSLDPEIMILSPISGAMFTATTSHDPAWGQNSNLNQFWFRFYFHVIFGKNLPVPSSRSWREHGFGGEGLKPHLWLGRS